MVDTNRLIKEAKPFRATVMIHSDSQGKVTLAAISISDHFGKELQSKVVNTEEMSQHSIEPHLIEVVENMRLSIEEAGINEVIL